MLLWVISGALAPHLLDVLPPSWCIDLVFVGGVSLLIHGRTRRLGFFLLPCAWTLLSMQSGLTNRLSAAQVEPQALVGTITGLPVKRRAMLEFILRTERQGQPLVLARWYRDAPAVRAGDRWLLQARLRPPWGRVNFAGPDTEKRLFASGISGVATVSGGVRLPGKTSWNWRTDAWRHNVAERIRHVLIGYKGGGLVLALAVADRSGLDDQVRESLRITGTGHLLAISGMHIGLVAWFAFGVARFLAMPLAALRLGGSQLAFAACFSIAAAVTYAALAGFGTSTFRALAMLCVLLGGLLLRRSFSAWRCWLLALAVVLVWRPLSPLEAGFWLSFVAVAVLLAVFQPRPHNGNLRLAGLLRAQAAISLVMLPLGMELFQAAGAGGLVANLAAIPWVSMVTLPLALAGTALLSVSPAWSEAVLGMAAQSSAWASGVLGWLAGPLGHLYLPAHRPGLILTTLACLGGLVLLAPVAATIRGLGGLLILPALLQPDRAPERGGVEVRLLDVGQGLAAVVATENHVLLYDTGPGLPGHWDLHGSVIAPSLSAMGRRSPNRVIVSHGDLDHAGGLATISNSNSGIAMLVNQANPPPGQPGCHDRRRWNWDGVAFEVLHPSPWLPYSGNTSSCVLAIRAPAGSILLPGDIEASVERSLSLSGPGVWDLLITPHHGSRTSSRGEFLDWARPRMVLTAAGKGNRFGFPHPEVVERIRASGAVHWSTSDCGAITVRMTADGELEADSARRQRAAPWRWPPAPDCP